MTLIALDVDQKPFADWPDRALFWVKALDLQRAGRRPAVGARIGGGGAVLSARASPTSPSQLRAALEQFPGVKLIPFGWVAFFIFLYILLIGPGDYFFLKKVLKRMELTWITFPTIVVTVSLLAYFAAYVVKGNELRVNKVDVVDVDQAAGLVAGQHAGRTSSARRTATTTSRGRPAAARPRRRRRPTPAPAATPPRPPAGTEVVMSWFGVARDRVRRHGELEPAVQLRRRRLRLRSPTGERRGARGRPRSRSGAPSASPPAGSGPAAPLVEADLQPGRDRPARRDRHQPPGRPAGGRDRSPSASRSTCSARSAPGRRSGSSCTQRPQPLGLPQGRSGSSYLPDQPYEPRTSGSTGPT